MRKLLKQPGRLMGVLLLGMACALPWSQSQAAHDIRGIEPDTAGIFNLYTFPFNMSLPEGTSLYMWGFGDMNGGVATRRWYCHRHASRGRELLSASVPGADPDRD